MDRQCLPMQPFGDDVEGHPEYMVRIYKYIFIYTVYTCYLYVALICV